jgi:hypothetical protein
MSENNTSVNVYDSLNPNDLSGDVTFDKQKAKEGGILPLLALLPLIFGGVAAAGGVAGGVSAAVQAANSKKAEDEKIRLEQEKTRLQLEEEKRHNKLNEEAMKASATAAASIAANNALGIKSGLGIQFDAFGKKAELTDLQLKLLKNTLKPLLSKIGVTFTGEGMYLYPSNVQK